jgi:hypothetical protein
MTYRVYFDEFCPEFIEWLRSKFVVLWDGERSMIIDLQHMDASAETIVEYIGMMTNLSPDKNGFEDTWNLVTRAIIGMCPWM